MLSVEKALKRQLKQQTRSSQQTNKPTHATWQRGAAALKLSKTRTHKQLWRLDVVERSRGSWGLHENGRLILGAHRLPKYEIQRKEHWASVTKKGKARGYFGKSDATVAGGNLQRGEGRGERHEGQSCTVGGGHLCSRVVQALAARVLVNEASLPRLHACTPA
jgi:hypothetical protein